MNLMGGLWKYVYWPLCRAYARGLGDRPADRLLQGMSSLQFRSTYGFWPNFLRPSRFSEKVWRRQLFDRDRTFTLISDKYKVRNFVADRVGTDYLIPLLWCGDNPEELPFDELPSRFVIKANHGCDYNILVSDKTRLDRRIVKKQLRKWIGENFGESTFLGIAWAYKNIEPRIIVEEFLEDEGKLPQDYKFFCFSGRMEFFKIDFARFEDHSEKFFDKNLNGLDLIELGLKEYDGPIELPGNFSEMVRVAELLSVGFDFIRVDLYNVRNRIFFGELTPYPGGVSARFVPDSFDYVFGEKWKQS